MGPCKSLWKQAYKDMNNQERSLVASLKRAITQAKLSIMKWDGIFRIFPLLWECVPGFSHRGGGFLNWIPECLHLWQYCGIVLRTTPKDPSHPSGIANSLILYIPLCLEGLKSENWHRAQPSCIPEYFSSSHVVNIKEKFGRGEKFPQTVTPLSLTVIGSCYLHWLLS